MSQGRSLRGVRDTLGKALPQTWVTDQVPSGQTEVIAPLMQGSEYGPASCGKPLDFGIEADAFTVQDSGDITGTSVWYLGTGEIRIAFDLTPVSNDGLSFNSGSYTGKLTVSGGVGAYAGVTGSGTSTCTTPDGGVHTSCTDNVTIDWPAAKTKKPSRRRTVRSRGRAPASARPRPFRRTWLLRDAGRNSKRTPGHVLTRPQRRQVILERLHRADRVIALLETANRRRQVVELV
jgi:hypothetical protein